MRPRLSDEIPGERIKLSCQFSIGTAQEDGMFNVTGTCSYGFTPDYEKIEEQLAIRKQKWKDEDIFDSTVIGASKSSMIIVQTTCTYVYVRKWLISTIRPAGWNVFMYIASRSGPLFVLPYPLL